VPGFPRPSRIAAVTLAQIVEVAGGSRSVTIDPGGAADASGVAVTGVTHDSTQVRPGDLYVALRGRTRHGAEFADQAVGAGAVAVLTDPAGVQVVRSANGPAAQVPVLVVEDPRSVLGAVAARTYGDPTADLLVIGLTGTAGKTSTSYLVESGLAAAGHTTCLIGTVETRIGSEVLDSVHTTPEATDLHALFAVARERGVTAAVMEVSSHALTYGRVGGVQFDVGGFTNFGQDHLDFHADLADYFAAKARLFDGRCRREVLNLDDEAVRSLVRPDSITFSASGNPAATWRAENITRSGFTQAFTAIHEEHGAVEVTVAMPGRHNVANALLALACLVAVGVPAKVAAEGIGACRGVPGRLELVGPPEAQAAWPVLGVVDYAHKPDAIAAALAALREVATGRLLCVVGAGGDRDRGKRPLMGAAAAREADLVVVTDDNPRSEDPATIRAEVLAGAAAAGGARHGVIEVAGRRSAIVEAVRLAEPGDVIAVLGKGHERGQEIAGVVTPFDDRVELAAALRDRFGPPGGWTGSPAGEPGAEPGTEVRP
jgi:UDP-N-acetylmuramoyl-L-alanyl-D-glutamate--2,6-diaminopimelate ligase